MRIHAKTTRLNAAVISTSNRKETRQGENQGEIRGEVPTSTTSGTGWHRQLLRNSTSVTTTVNCPMSAWPAQDRTEGLMLGGEWNFFHFYYRYELLFPPQLPRHVQIGTYRWNIWISSFKCWIRPECTWWTLNYNNEHSNKVFDQTPRIMSHCCWIINY